MNICGWEGLSMSTRWLGMLLGLPHLKWPVGMVFIATNQIVAVGEGCWWWAHRTVWCAATSSCSSGLELVDHWRLCPHAAPYSPVRHRTVRCPSDQLLWLLPCSLCCTVPCQSQPLRADSRCSAGAPDSPVVHRTVRWTIAELRLGNPKVKSLSWFTLVHRTLSGGTPDSPVRQTRTHFGFLFAPFFWSLTCSFDWFVLNLWHL
jgi:hypothetical protein